tara:strand:+ start:5481 stop:6119 length:639 start_codon:yes stop_codon:yes gene_type:complete
MSRVRLTTVSPGTTTGITRNNQLQDDIETGLSQINQQNIRVEGIDKRNVAFPICEESGHAATYSTWGRVSVPSTGSNWASHPTTSFSVSVAMADCYAAIVRFSGEVRLEGGTTSGVSVFPQWLGVRMAEMKDGTPVTLPHTQRHFQVGRHPSPTLKFPCTFPFQITHLVKNENLSDTSNRTYSLEYRFFDPSSPAGTATIGFLTGHIQKYKG